MHCSAWAIILQYSCTEVEGSKLTKLGNRPEDVAEKADILLKITMGAVCADIAGSLSCVLTDLSECFEYA